MGIGQVSFVRSFLKGSSKTRSWPRGHHTPKRFAKQASTLSHNTYTVICAANADYSPPFTELAPSLSQGGLKHTHTRHTPSRFTQQLRHKGGDDIPNRSYISWADHSVSGGGGERVSAVGAQLTRSVRTFKWQPTKIRSLDDLGWRFLFAFWGITRPVFSTSADKSRTKKRLGDNCGELCVCVVCHVACHFLRALHKLCYTMGEAPSVL